MVMNFIRKLMYGRYGSDQLSFFLLVVYIVLILLSGLPHHIELKGIPTFSGFK